MKQGLTYQLTERKGAADGHSAAVPLSGAFNYIDKLEAVDLFSAEISSTYTDLPDPHKLPSTPDGEQRFSPLSRILFLTV